APGLHSPEEWRVWAAQTFPPAGVGQPELVELPVRLRRRLSALGRMAVQVAYWCQSAASGIPVVMASRYGDAERSIALLTDLARQSPLSPTAFGLSVHNAIAAQY